MKKLMMIDVMMNLRMAVRVTTMAMNVLMTTHRR